MPNPGSGCAACLTGGHDTARDVETIGEEGIAIDNAVIIDQLPTMVQEILALESEAKTAEQDEMRKELKASLKKELLEELPNAQAVREVVRGVVVAQMMQDLPRLVQELREREIAEDAKRALRKGDTHGTESTDTHTPRNPDTQTTAIQSQSGDALQSQSDHKMSNAGTDTSKQRPTKSMEMNSRSLKTQKSALVVENDGLEDSVGELCQARKSDGSPILDARANEQGAQDWVYVWSETMWDAMPFIGLNVMPSMDSILVVFIALLNLAIQAAFVGLVGTNMTESLFQDDEIVETLQDWRVSYAHNPDFADKFKSTPLAKDVCSQSSFLMQGANQAGIYNEVVEYIQHYLGMPAGGVLSVLSIFLWILTCCKEMKRICLFLVGLWTPTEDGGRCCNRDIKKSHVVVQERTVLWIYGEPMQKNYQLFMTNCRVTAVTVFVIIPRFIILCGLGFVGTRFLVATTELDELILNCVALEVILNVDELLFIIFVPDSAARMVRKSKPLRVPKLRGFTARIMPWIRFAVVTALMLLISFLWLMPMIDTMLEVERVMCAGKVDFLAKEMTFGSVVSGTPSTGIIERSKYWYRAIYERTGLDSSSSVDSLSVGWTTSDPKKKLGLTIEDNTFAFSKVEELVAWHSRSIEEWANLDVTDPTYLACQDIHWETWHYGYEYALFGGLSSLLGIEVTEEMQERKCKVFRPYCFTDTSIAGKALRLICPETCGGGKPLSGLVQDRVDDGTPWQCQAEYISNLAELDCADHPVSILSNSSHEIGRGWSNYAKNVNTIMDNLFKGMALGNETHYEYLTKMMEIGMMTYGCGFFSASGPYADTGGKVVFETAPSEWHDQWEVDFCNVEDPNLLNMRTVRAFCPQTCGCHTTVKQNYLGTGRIWDDKTGRESQCPKKCWAPP